MICEGAKSEESSQTESLSLSSMPTEPETTVHSVRAAARVDVAYTDVGRRLLD